MKPLVFGIGFAVLVLVAFSGWLADSVVTVTHEGGHMITFLMTGREVSRFTLTDHPDRVNGETFPAEDKGRGLGDMIVRFAGYPAPSAAGLGGAYVVADGNSWGVLWVGIVLLAAALLVARGTTAFAVTAAALVGVGWAAVAGGPRVQAAVAVGLCGCC